MFQDLSQRSIKTGFLADLRRGSNSLNSDTVQLTKHTGIRNYHPSCV